MDVASRLRKAEYNSQFQKMKCYCSKEKKIYTFSVKNNIIHTDNCSIIKK